MRAETVLFELINSVVFERELRSEIKDCMTDELRAKLIRLSGRHDLSHLVAGAMSHLGLLRADTVSDGLRKALKLSIYRDEQRQDALEQVSSVLERAKIPHIPLKGAVLRELYPEGWMRTSCDIDILVRAEDVESALGALCDAGFCPRNVKTRYDCSLVSPGGVHLELHHALTADDRLTEAVEEMLGCVWEYTLPTDGLRLRMTEEMLLFYHIAHMAKHFVIGGCGVRPFIDLQLMRDKLTFRADVLGDMLDRAKLRRFCDAAFALCDVWFESSAHDLLTERMEQYVLSGGVYGTGDNYYTMVRAKKGDNRIKMYGNKIFMSRAGLEFTYPRLKKYPFLLPYYHCKRWFRVFDREKRQDFQNRTAWRTAIAQDAAEAGRGLLADVGLGEQP